MVSFQCDACQDVVKKPKLDNHRSRCGASFTCLDCNTTFTGPHQYKGHTSCVSEAQKYEKGLYKGPKGGATPNGHQNGRQNGAGFGQPMRSRGSGSNGQPLGENVKMTYTPPNEPSTQATPTKIETISAPGPTPATAAEAAIREEIEVTTGKKKKPRKKREPPPPGETRAERKKRKKIERTARKAEKLKLKAQMKAAKSEAIAAKKREKREKKEEKTMLTRADGPAPDIALPEDAPELAVPPAEQPQAEEAATKSKKSKERKHLEEINGDTDMAAPSEEVEKPKKKKKSKETKTAAEPVEMEVDAPLTNGQNTDDAGEKKSKKRKRDAEDVGEKDVVDEMVGLSFKERARAEKKARKQEKRAKNLLLLLQDV